MTLEELKNKMPEITGFLFTHPNLQDDRVTEVWMKFRNDGLYVYINLEQPIPKNIEPQKLVGSGNALNCSECKKDKLIAYVEKKGILEILEKSTNFNSNNETTVNRIRDLINSFTERFLHN